MDKSKEVIIIGAGLSGLTCGALLAKRGIKVKVIESQFKPGGSCGIFKRNDVIFEQGAAMLYGFGEKGFNPHRFVFNCLEEPIDIIKHDELYAINYGKHRIIFYDDINKFINQLITIFPNEEHGFRRFYKDMEKLYIDVIAAHPTYISPDIVKKEDGLKQFLDHPMEYVKFLGYLNASTESVLKKYFNDKEVFKFFDKLTSTYCYTTVSETPAILSSIMFIDNHYGGSYYPVGSTLNLVGKLEKVIEENHGEMIYNREVVKVLVQCKKAIGVQLEDDSIIEGDYIVYSGNVWNLYRNLIKDDVTEKVRKDIEDIVPTYSSLVLYSLVKERAIPKGTLPIEMLVSNTEKIDENELTAYILSLDDKSICKEGYHTVVTIGPSFRKWPNGRGNYRNDENYKKAKNEEMDRILNVLENRFPGFKENLVYKELATPSTLERYAMKEGGAVAGPKQKLGQHMLKRLHVNNEIKGLYCCGESTVMGTGTPAVTVSGISAANMILRTLEMEEYEYNNKCKQYVNIIKNTDNQEKTNIKNNEERTLLTLANECQFCENPLCEKSCSSFIPIRDINRRVAVGNFYGAKMILVNRKEEGLYESCKNCKNKKCEDRCKRREFSSPVKIKEIISRLESLKE